MAHAGVSQTISWCSAICLPVTTHTQQFHIRGRARGVDAIQKISPSSPKQLVFEGHHVPSRCSEEIADAVIVSARLITLHPNVEPSSIT